jgi:hypothetical protein
MIFRIHHETKGGHVHCRFFAGPHEGALGKCGEFTMRADEFDHFAWLTRSRIEFDPPTGYAEDVSSGAAHRVNQLLESVRLKLTPQEYQRAFNQIAGAIDDTFELGIRSAGGMVIDDPKPRAS